MAEPTINPYNFVPLPQEGPQRTDFPGLHRLASAGYSGSFRCEIEVLSPLFSADQQHASRAEQGQKKFPFLRNGRGEPIIQGTTLKGMIRAVYEALSNACLPLTTVAGGRGRNEYNFTLPEAYQHSACVALQTLCPACRLFGVIQGEAVHAQGRVVLTDAVLSEGALASQEILLPELSSPKPSHHDIYSKTRQRSGPIAGRKFFYHQRPDIQPGIEARRWSPRASGITELAPVGTRFTFTLLIQGLTESELARLVACLALEEGLGHKVGMAKPLGFGSCRIHILPEVSVLYRGETRYQQWHTPSLPLDVQALKAKAEPFPKELREVLRLDKYQDGTIGYLPYGGYRGIGINAQGRYVPAQADPPPRGRLATPQETIRTGVTLGEQLASGQGSQGQPKGATSEGKTFKRGDKIRAEVIDRTGNRFTLRVLDTGQEIVHEALHLPWRKGERLRVTVVAVDSDGRIRRIRL